jgi:hypothetical protein
MTSIYDKIYKKTELKTLKDWLDLAYLLSLFLVSALSIAYISLTWISMPFFGDYSRLISTIPAYLFILIALTSGIALYITNKQASQKVQITAAFLYTILMGYLFLVLSRQIGAELISSLYTIWLGVQGGLIVMLSVLFIWIHAFYRNK